MFNKKHYTIQEQARRLKKLEDQLPEMRHAALAADALAYVSGWIDTVAHETAVKSGSDVEDVMILQTLASDCRNAAAAVGYARYGFRVSTHGNGGRFSQLIDGE